MIKKFSVEGFKGFNEEIVLDFSKIKGYTFAQGIIKNDLVNKAMLYGRSGTGKSNLGLALFDIVHHMSDTLKSQNLYSNYLNTENLKDEATFKYTFFLNDNIIQYEYIKSNYNEFRYERLDLNGTKILEYNFSNGKYINKIMQSETLNMSDLSNHLSALRYVINHANLSQDNILMVLKKFVDSMLWFDSSAKGVFTGILNGTKIIDDAIVNSKNGLKKLDEFMRSLGFDYNFTSELDSQKANLIYVDHGDIKNKKRWNSVFSSGESALMMFFAWYIYAIEDKVSFLYIDEFDAFYNFEVSRDILRLLITNENVQTVLTTHNTNLISNKLMRPDAYYVISENRIINLAFATKKDIRQGHNLEKLYLGGEFEVR